MAALSLRTYLPAEVALLLHMTALVHSTKKGRAKKYLHIDPRTYTADTKIHNPEPPSAFGRGQEGQCFEPVTEDTNSHLKWEMAFGVAADLWLP